MRKALALLTAISLILSTNGIAFAAYEKIGSKTFTATTTPTGIGGVTVGFEAELKNLADDSSTTTIGWTNVVSGTTGWKISNQYIAVKGFANFSDGWGIQIYTNNIDYTGTGNPAGLIRQDNKIYSLPMCWRTKVGYVDPESATGAPKKKGSESITAQEKEIIQGVIKKDGKDIVVLYDAVPGHEPGGADEGKEDYFPWFFILDKRTDLDPNPDIVKYFGDYYFDTTFIGDKGYHHAPGDIAINFATPSDPKDTYNIYMGANFTMSVPGKTYSTNAITVEIYHL